MPVFSGDAPICYSDGSRLWVGDECFSARIDHPYVESISYEPRTYVDLSTIHGRQWRVSEMPSVAITIKGVAVARVGGGLPDMRAFLDKFTVLELFEAIQRKLNAREGGRADGP